MKRRRIFPLLFAGLAALTMFPPAGVAQNPPARRAAAAPALAKSDRFVVEKSGSFVVRDGQRLRLLTDIGNVRIHTQNSGRVSYTVRVEADAREPGAQQFLSQFALNARAVPYGVLMNASVPWREFRGRLWVTFELNVPHDFQIDVNTQTGNIETESVDGRVTLVTGGGNLTSADVGGPARLETQGGHITVHDVAGDLTAISAGGHMTVGNVKGDAMIRTGGGHIRVASVANTAHLETGGGNIALQHAGASITAHTTGGRIDLGETAGAIRASTGGGNIGVLKLIGPTQLESRGGSICLTKVQGSLRASTTAGTITAWFIPEGKLHGPSQLESGTGDILIYIPRELAITIDAIVEEPASEWGVENSSKNTASIEADPAIPLKVSYVGAGPAQKQMRAEAALNGGGEVLRLKTATGRIRLRYSDSPRLAVETDLDAARRQIEFQLKMSREAMERQVERQMRIMERHTEAQRQAEVTAADAARKAQSGGEWSSFQDWQRRVMSFWSGRLRVDPNQQKQRLISSSAPAYPALARMQRIEGVVRLDVYISGDGTVEDVKILSGREILARAAVAAVKQWRFAPVVVDSKAVPVVTAMDVDFRLN